MFTKKIISFILIFLVVFSTHIQEKEIQEIDAFSLARIQNNIKVADEVSELPENF